MITLFNAAPDTGNQGVSALCHSVVAGLTNRGAEQITVADHGRGLRRADWDYCKVGLIGLTNHRRFWRSDNLKLSHLLLKAGAGMTQATRVIKRSNCILDISGGDSFTDIYGAKRFQAMALTKQLALNAGIPLVLLPQKIGPFHDPECEAQAISILRRAAAVWVRDQHSLRYLQTVLGKDFDEKIHHVGMDVAVALPKQRPSKLSRQVESWLSPNRDFTLAGINVSGLLCNDPDGARSNFDLTDIHTDQIQALAQSLLETDRSTRLMLIPHVQRPEGDCESDLDAARWLKAQLGPEVADRVLILEDPLNAMQLKWVLSQLDWFTGARMHATIGAFSSGVPTLGLGYTDKAYGVFAECGIGKEVIDLRTTQLADLVQQATASFANRVQVKAVLKNRLESIKRRAAGEMDLIARQAGLNH